MDHEESFKVQLSTPFYLVDDASGTQIVLLNNAVLGRGNFSKDDGNIGRRHCMFRYDESQNSLTVEDLSSVNGTVLNGRKIIPQQQYEITHGSKIGIGKYTLTVQDSRVNPDVREAAIAQTTREHGYTNTAFYCMTVVNLLSAAAPIANVFVNQPSALGNALQFKVLYLESIVFLVASTFLLYKLIFDKPFSLLRKFGYWAMAFVSATTIVAGVEYTTKVLAPTSTPSAASESDNSRLPTNHR